jgi:tetraacyldisaccharide 4'-kinase
VGDEPALARRHVPTLWLGIDRNRHEVGRLIAGRASSPCFILDDGFQHRRLHRDLDLVVIDASQPLAENHVLPWGTLREPLRGLQRADAIMINGAATCGRTDALVAMVRAINPGAAVYRCEQRIQSLVPLRAWRHEQRPVEHPAQTCPVFLVAAIGNPQRFRRDVESLGIDVRGARFYRDHQRLGPEDWSTCLRESRACGATLLVTTEKDAIKLPENLDLPLAVSVQSVRVAEEGELQRRIAALLSRFDERF